MAKGRKRGKTASSNNSSSHPPPLPLFFPLCVQWKPSSSLIYIHTGYEASHRATTAQYYSKHTHTHTHSYSQALHCKTKLSATKCSHNRPNQRSLPSSQKCLRRRYQSSHKEEYKRKKIWNYLLSKSTWTQSTSILIQTDCYTIIRLLSKNAKKWHEPEHRF